MTKTNNSMVPTSTSSSSSTIDVPTNENLLFVLFSLIGLSLIKVNFTVILITVILMYMLYVNSRPYAKLLMNYIDVRTFILSSDPESDYVDSEDENNVEKVSENNAEKKTVVKQK